MRVLVCGDRHWTDSAMIARKLAELGCGYAPLTIIHGACRGADRLAGEYATGRATEVLSFPADWDKYGRAAGPIRNQQMLDAGKPELVIAFHDDLTRSKGTSDMVRRAKKAGVRVEVVSHGC